MRSSRVIELAAVVTAALALGACGAAAESTKAGRARAPRSSSATVAALAAPSAGSPTQPCGPRGPEVLAAAAGMVAERIYAGELGGAETRSDQRQVESYGPLLSAVSAGNRAAIKAAVTSLVFSHTHVVRLRITRGASVLADIGGPYILAPVGGKLRLHGHAIGRYLLSVQDDLGYVKLVTRFLGVPLVMRAGSRGLPVAGLLAPGPARIPDHGAVRYRGVSYQAFSFGARSFPSGALRISLLVPVPGSLARMSCPAIRAAELGHAAQLISRRFKLSSASFAVYIKLVHSLTDGLVYVLAGRRRLAGSTQGPSRLPRSGAISYRGARYLVTSFKAPSSLGPVRVYDLVRG